jgi:hypothetical protein
VFQPRDERAGAFSSSPWGSRRSDRHVFCICLRNSPLTR